MAGDIFNPEKREIAGNVQQVAPVTDSSVRIKEQEALRQSGRTTQVVQQALAAAPGVAGAAKSYRAAKAVQELTGGISHVDEIIPNPDAVNGSATPTERQEAVEALDNLNSLGAARKAGAISGKEYEIRRGSLLREAKRNSPYAAQQLDTAYNKLRTNTSDTLTYDEKLQQSRQQGIAAYALSMNNDIPLATKFYDAEVTSKARSAVYEQDKRSGSITASRASTYLTQNASTASLGILGLAQNFYAEGNGTLSPEAVLSIRNHGAAKEKHLISEHQASIQAIRRNDPSAVIPQSLTTNLNSALQSLRSQVRNVTESRAYSSYLESVIKEVDGEQSIEVMKMTGIGPTLAASPMLAQVMEAIGTSNPAALAVYRKDPAMRPLIDVFENDQSRIVAVAKLRLGATNALFDGQPNPDAIDPPPPQTALTPTQAASLLMDTAHSKGSVHTYAAAVNEGGAALERLYSAYTAQPQGVVHWANTEYKALTIQQPSTYQPIVKEAIKRSTEETNASLIGAEDFKLVFNTQLDTVFPEGVPARNQSRTTQAITAQYKVLRAQPHVYQQAGFDTPEEFMRHTYKLPTMKTMMSAMDQLPPAMKEAFSKLPEKTPKSNALADIFRADDTDMLESERMAIESAVDLVIDPANEDMVRTWLNISLDNAHARLRYHDTRKAFKKLKRAM